MILFEMLVGQPPFLAPTPTETQLKVSKQGVCACVTQSLVLSTALVRLGPLLTRIKVEVILVGCPKKRLSYSYYTLNFLY